MAMFCLYNKIPTIMHSFMFVICQHVLIVYDGRKHGNDG